MLMLLQGWFLPFDYFFPLDGPCFPPLFTFNFEGVEDQVFERKRKRLPLPLSADGLCAGEVLQ